MTDEEKRDLVKKTEDYCSTWEDSKDGSYGLCLDHQSSGQYWKIKKELELEAREKLSE